MSALRPRPARYMCGVMYRRVNGRELICGRRPKHQGNHAQRMTLPELMAWVRPRPKGR